MPFGYSIDYDKAIAQDERELAAIDWMIANRLFRSDKHPDCHELWEMVVVDGEFAERAGFLPHERGCLAEYVEAGIDFLHPETELPSDWYEQGKALFTRLDDTPWSLSTEEQIKKDRRKVKARLARHRRNQKKHGN